MSFETCVTFAADADVIEQVTERFAQEDLSLADGLHLLLARIARTGLPFELHDERDALRHRDKDRLCESLEREAPDIGDEDLTMQFAVLRERARQGRGMFGGD